MKYLLHKGYKLAFTFLLLNFCFEGIAQYNISISAGYSNNHLQTDISNCSYTQNRNGNSFGMGVSLNYTFNNKIIFQTGIDMLYKNYSFVRTGNYVGIYTSYRNIYLQLPVIIQYKIYQKNKWQFFADVGFFVSYWVSGKIRGTIPNVFNSYDSVNAMGQITHYLRYTSYFQKHQFNNSKDNRFELGALAGITTLYQLNKKYSLILNYRFYQSFISKQKEYTINQVKQYNQALFISLGFILYLHT